MYDFRYVLLKEKNMLLTMEYESNEKAKLFPSPERIDKVEESMKNLETVVRERNTAYHLLETGIDGERPKEMVTNQMGFRFLYKLVRTKRKVKCFKYCNCFQAHSTFNSKTIKHEMERTPRFYSSWECCYQILKLIQRKNLCWQTQEIKVSNILKVTN